MAQFMKHAFLLYFQTKKTRKILNINGTDTLPIVYFTLEKHLIFRRAHIFI